MTCCSTEVGCLERQVVHTLLPCPGVGDLGPPQAMPAVLPLTRKIPLNSSNWKDKSHFLFPFSTRSQLINNSFV